MPRVGFQGVLGAYSEMAARGMFPARGLRLVPCEDFASVFRLLSAEQLDYAVVPIENSLAGSIHENYDHLLNHDVWIRGELRLPIDHCLMAPPGSTLGDIREVRSHPQALSQCQAFIRRLGARPVAAFDTAGAAQQLAQAPQRHVAAIASSQAASAYGLRILRRSIQDERSNFTRFYCLQRAQAKRPTLRGPVPALTTLVLSLKHQPGALHRALSIFAIRDIDLLKIESRPKRRSPFEYLFYLDIGGAITDSAVARAMDHLAEITVDLRVLGSYPAARASHPDDSTEPRTADGHRTSKGP